MNNLKTTENYILKHLIKTSTIEHINIDFEFNKTNVFLHSIYCYNTDNAKKQKLLMIHGTAGNITSFAHIVDYLTPYFNIYIIDLPGFGQSLINKDDLINLSNIEVLDFYTHVIKHYIDKIIKPKKDLTCFGFSFGGLLAIEFEHKYPTYFQKLILMSTAGIFPFSSKFTFYMGMLFKISFPQNILRLLGRNVIHILSYVIKMFSHNLYYDLILLGEKHTFGDLLIGKFISVEGLTVYHNYPVIFKLLGLRCKVRLIYTENDCIMPVSHGYKINQMSKGSIPLHVIKQFGHSISYIDGDVVANAIIKMNNHSDKFNHVIQRNNDNIEEQMNKIFAYKCSFNIFKSEKIIRDFYENFENI